MSYDLSEKPHLNHTSTTDSDFESTTTLSVSNAKPTETKAIDDEKTPPSPPPRNLNRKPVPVAKDDKTKAKKHAVIQEQPPQYDEKRIDTADETNPPRVSTASFGPPPAIPDRSPLRPITPSPRQSRFSALTRLKSRFTLLPKRKKLILLLSLVASVLIILIIGLAAGLTAHKHQNLPLPNNHGGPYSGDLTYYDPALGACGITSTSSDSIVSISHTVFDSVSTSANPNANPLCGKKIRASRDGVSIDLTVVDRCTGCKSTDIDVTESVFKTLTDGDLNLGRTNVSWAWLEDVAVSGDM